MLGVKGWGLGIVCAVAAGSACGGGNVTSQVCVKNDNACARAVAQSLGNEIGNDRIKCEVTSPVKEQCYDRVRAWTGVTLVRVTSDGRWSSKVIVMPDNTKKHMPISGSVR
jgi:hypothetical protein